MLVNVQIVEFNQHDHDFAEFWHCQLVEYFWAFRAQEVHHDGLAFNQIYG